MALWEYEIKKKHITQFQASSCHKKKYCGFRRASESQLKTGEQKT